jgi:hypothetical protein
MVAQDESKLQGLLHMARILSAHECDQIAANCGIAHPHIRHTTPDPQKCPLLWAEAMLGFIMVCFFERFVVADL